MKAKEVMPKKEVSKEETTSENEFEDDVFDGLESLSD
jgi:hypothetical protein